MLTAKYYLVLQENEEQQGVFLTSHPEAVLYGLESTDRRISTVNEVWIWDHPYPLWLAELIRDLLQAQMANARPNRQRLGKKIKRTVKSWGQAANGRWVAGEEMRAGHYSSAVDNIPFCHAKEAASTTERCPATALPVYTDAIARTLSGRLLTLKELHLVLGRKGRSVSLLDLEYALQRYIFDGSVLLRAGVGPDRFGRFTCRRCGSTDRVVQTYTEYSPQRCWCCEACRSMGVITSSTPLYQWVGRQPDAKPVQNIRLLLPELTWWQKKGVQEAMDFWQEKDGEDQRSKILLIWAVCGAGKTEIIFPLIQQTLNAGQRVLLTVPRREVAADLGKRVEKAFPGLEFALLYGGVKREPTASLLTICTTHQLLRFAHCFDLAILDEADAFPFSYEPMLARALHGALRPEGKLVYMTATPDAVWRKQARQGKISLIRIPLRHHGYPLPVPVLKKLPLPALQAGEERGMNFPKEIIDFLIRVMTRARRVLVFVPTVKAAEIVGHQLQVTPALSHGESLDYVHSGDPRREEKLAAFADGKLRILVTTTLLERGLTFPDLDVLVLYADQMKIFSTETLVQIAGRVGRSASSPTGEVVMIARNISQQMREAKEWIEQMNREAEQLKGFNGIKD